MGVCICPFCKVQVLSIQVRKHMVQCALARMQFVEVVQTSIHPDQKDKRVFANMLNRDTRLLAGSKWNGNVAKNLPPQEEMKRLEDKERKKLGDGNGGGVIDV